MSEPLTLEDLEKRVKTLEKAASSRREYVVGCEYRLREAALCYARVIKHGVVIKKGVRDILGYQEKIDLTNHYADEMKRIAIELLLELGIAGE